MSVPTDFYEQLSAKYSTATKEGDVLFNGDSAVSEVVSVQLANQQVPFQLTLLKSLQHRPENGSKEDNPFAKPEPELTIVDPFFDEFRIVFNKFPVVARHFMIVTRQFRSQNTPLSPAELAASYAVLRALSAQAPAERWFAFYNCGPNSGASQPHKHIQFMTLPENFTPHMETLANQSEPFIPLLKREPLQDKELPYAHFVAKLPNHELSEEDLVMYFMSLLLRTLTVLRQNNCDHISYNFCMTTSYMAMVPRKVGKYKGLGLNSCGAMGLMLCKDQQLLDMVREDGPEQVMAAVGFPNTADQPTDEYDY